MLDKTSVGVDWVGDYVFTAVVELFAKGESVLGQRDVEEFEIFGED